MLVCLFGIMTLSNLYFILLYLFRKVQPLRTVISPLSASAALEQLPVSGVCLSEREKALETKQLVFARENGQGGISV